MYHVHDMYSAGVIHHMSSVSFCMLAFGRTAQSAISVSAPARVLSPCMLDEASIKGTTDEFDVVLRQATITHKRRPVTR